MADKNGCAECINKEGTLAEALQNIIWYNGHYNWLRDLRDILTNLPEDEFYNCPFDTKEWHNEPHVIWMLLVGMFGDWGTSIRSGWIEDKEGCIAFINQICEESWRIDEERKRN